jgi:hypothetical protein
MLLVVVLVGLATGFAVSTVAQQKDTVDPKIEQQIRALASKYDDAFNRNDAPAVTALYKEDGFVRLTEYLTVGRPSKNRMHSISRDGIPTSRFTTAIRISAVGNEGTFERKMERDL